MIETFASLLIVLMIAVGSFYASLRYHSLVSQRDTLADEYKRAEAHIQDLEERILLLEAQVENSRPLPRASGDGTGWNAFEPRG